MRSSSSLVCSASKQGYSADTSVKLSINTLFKIYQKLAAQELTVHYHNVYTQDALHCTFPLNANPVHHDIQAHCVWCGHARAYAPLHL